MRHGSGQAPGVRMTEWPEFSKEFVLLAACCRWPVDRDRVRAVAAGPIDWGAFVRIAHRHRVLAMTHHAASLAGLPMPAVRITAESVSASKPDPEGFLKGAAELGFAPRDCVVFEDSAAGIAAGLAAGMRVVGVGPRAAGEPVTAHVDTLEQIRVEAAADGTLHLHVH